MKNYLMVIVLFLVSCEQVIDLQPKGDFRGTVVVEGLLVVDQAPRIYLNEALPFANAKVTPQEVFARGAIVTITDSSGPEVLQADSLFDQFRCRWKPFYEGSKIVRYGESYDLEISFKGKIYRASTRILQNVPSIVQITYIGEFFDIYGGHDGVKINLQDPEGPGNFYRFQMNREIDNSVSHAHVLDVIKRTCTAPDEKFWVSDLGRTVFNDEALDGQSMELFIEVSFEYSQGDSAWVTIQSLDEKAAAFYQELDDQLITLLNPFVEPVFLKSQIDGGALGFFGSAVLTDSVLFIYPQDNP